MLKGCYQCKHRKYFHINICGTVQLWPISDKEIPICALGIWFQTGLRIYWHN